MVRCDICTCLTRKWQSWARTLSSIFVTRQCNRLKDLKVENRNEVFVIVINITGLLITDQLKTTFEVDHLVFQKKSSTLANQKK